MRQPKNVMEREEKSMGISAIKKRLNEICNTQVGQTAFYNIYERTSYGNNPYDFRNITLTRGTVGTESRFGFKINNGASWRDAKRLLEVVQDEINSY